MNSFQKELEEIKHFITEFDIPNTELSKELNALVQGADDVVLFLYSRRALEVIITEMCEELMNRDRGSEPLKGLIDRLYKDKFIPAYIHTSMSNLNSMSTYGAHPKEFNQRQVKSTIIELTTVLEWYIGDLKKLEKKSFQDSQPEINETPVEERLEEKKTEQPKPESTVKEEVKPVNKEIAESQKKKPIGVIVGVVIVALVAVGYLMFFNSGDQKEEKKVAEQVSDTSSNLKAENNERDKNEELIQEKKADVSTTKPETKKPEEIEISLPDDLDEAFNKINEFEKLEMKHKAGRILLKRFDENDAWILFSEVEQSRTAKDYILNRIPHLENFEFKTEVINIDDNSGKITRLKVEEIKK